MGSDKGFPTLAEYRHPEVAELCRRLREDDRYRAVWGQAESVLMAADDLEPGMEIRLLTDLIVKWVPNLHTARGRVIHALVFDHAYEEIAAMVGLSRQRIHEIHMDWLDKTSTQPWPSTGRWSRIQERRSRDKAETTE